MYFFNKIDQILRLKIAQKQKITSKTQVNSSNIKYMNAYEKRTIIEF